MKKVVLIGASGFVGSAILNEEGNHYLRRTVGKLFAGGGKADFHQVL